MYNVTVNVYTCMHMNIFQCIAYWCNFTCVHATTEIKGVSYPYILFLVIIYS